jgi:hypothetical protein
MSWSSSIVFSDSIPLLSFFQTCQEFFYLPISILRALDIRSIILMGLFSFKLMRLFVDSKYASVIFTVFFVVAPTELNQLRWYGALFGHWMIVAALYLYFSKKSTTGKWIALTVCTSRVHAYLLGDGTGSPGD